MSCKFALEPVPVVAVVSIQLKRYSAVDSFKILSLGSTLCSKYKEPSLFVIFFIRVKFIGTPLFAIAVAACTICKAETLIS